MGYNAKEEVFTTSFNEFVDSLGQTKNFEEVHRLAKENILGSLSKSELIEDYMNNLSEFELLQWATNDALEFTD